jgi:hypothetical protein
MRYAGLNFRVYLAEILNVPRYTSGFRKALPEIYPQQIAQIIL